MAAKSNSKVTLKAKGIYTSYNRLASVPDGALLEASNVVIDKEDIIEPRRGFKLFGDTMGTATTHIAKQLINYKNRLLRHYQTSTTVGALEYQDTPGGTTFTQSNVLKMIFATSSPTGLTGDGTTAIFNCQKDHGLAVGDTVTIQGITTGAIIGFNGTFTVTEIVTSIKFKFSTASIPNTTGTASTGTVDFPVIVEATTSEIVEPETGVKIKSVEANGNTYFTTKTGVKKLDNYNGTIIDSGVPKALDIEPELYNEEGFFLPDQYVGYQILWGIKDFNDNLIIGAPSSISILANNSTETFFMNDFNALLDELDNDTYPSNSNYATIVGYISLTDSISTITNKIENANPAMGLAAKLNADTQLAYSGYLSGLPNPGATTYAQLRANFNFITGKLNSERKFIVTAANATAGDTYTNNTKTFTVSTTIVAGTTLYTMGTGAPTGSGTLTRTSGIGDAMITFSSSTRPSVYPTATTSQSVLVTATVPEGITTSHFYQLYRTSQSSASPPDRDFKLVYEGNPTYSQIYDGLVEIYDNQPDVLRESAVELYTDPNQEGDAQANNLVPFAKDIALYNGMTFYSNTKTRYLLAVDLVGVEDLHGTTTSATFLTNFNALLTKLDADTLGYNDYVHVDRTILGGDTLTQIQTKIESLTDKLDLDSVVNDTNYTAGLPFTGAIPTNYNEVIANFGYITNKLNNDSGVTDIDYEEQTTITFSNGTDVFVIVMSTVAENTSTGTAKITNNSTFVSIDIEDTAKSIVRVINRYASNSFINAYYSSGVDDAPGKIIFESVGISDPQFTLIAGGTFTHSDPGGNTVSMFNPQLITAESSINDTKTNRIYYSKLQEPEAVPALNYQDVGGGDNIIYRIKELRDGLFIFSSEGIFKLVGYSPQSLSLTLIDNTTSIVAPESLAKGNNLLYAFCDDGIITVSDSGVDIISRQIEDKLLKLQDPAYTAFATKTVGTFYDTDRKYILFTVQERTDTVATICYIYNILTNSWVTWDLGKSCALVNKYDDKLYFGSSDINSLEQERKNFDYTDHADREHVVSIESYSRNITSIAPSSPATTGIITSIKHGLTTGNLIEIIDSDCSPNIDGEQRVTVLSDNTFSVEPIDRTTGLPITVTSGTSGYWTTKETNIITVVLSTTNNVNVGDALVQELISTVDLIAAPYNYDFTSEAVITSINDSNREITLTNSNVFIVGSAKVYNKFDTNTKWIPIHAGDPSVDKQFREAHVMFDKYRGYGFEIEFSSDSKRSELLTSSDTQIINNYGRGRWGSGNWGGETGSNNMRVYVPQEKQRCRLLTMNFKTAKAREQWRLEGIALFLRFISERTNVD